MKPATLPVQPPGRRRPATSSSAFTLLELLVAIAIFGLVAGLLLPALYRCREAARRVECTSHLHQIGVALESYHAGHGALPPGWMEDGVTDTGWGWASMILPHLEEHALFSRLHFDRAVGAAANAEARLTSLALFRCPSDPAPLRFALYRAGAADQVLFELATANYVGVFGTLDPDETPGNQGDGAFLANRGLPLSAFADGLSKTVVVGERTARRLLSAWAGMHPQGEDGPARVVGFLDHPPNAPQADECEFSSRHPHGTLFLFGDSHVDFVTDHIDRATYRRLATRVERF